jgi:hypothetical protein
LWMVVGLRFSCGTLKYERVHLVERLNIGAMNSYLEASHPLFLCKKSIKIQFGNCRLLEADIRLQGVGRHPVFDEVPKLLQSAGRNVLNTTAGRTSWLAMAAPFNQNCNASSRKRMGATTFVTDSSHVPMLSQPDFLLDVIRQVANAR